MRARACTPGTEGATISRMRAWRTPLFLFLLAWATGDARELRACDSTGCLIVTRGAAGLLPKKAFRVDLSYRTTDDGALMSGSDAADRVTRPKVDFEHGLVRPGFHQDLGGRSHFLQL